MPSKRPPSEGERNITIALTDSELQLLKRVGRYSRTLLVGYIRNCPESIKAMEQAELEAMVKEAAPLDPGQLGRVIIVFFLQKHGALQSKMNIPRFLLGMIWGSASYSGLCPAVATEKKTPLTVSLSRSERAALNKVAAELAARVPEDRGRPSMLARFLIVHTALQCEAFVLDRGKKARELAARGTNRTTVRAGSEPDDA